jgi:TPR repeat protein
MKNKVAVLLLLLIYSWLSLPAQAQDKITECDRQAGHPSDPDKVVPGIDSKDVDHSKAVAACQQAMADDPNNARVVYQLGRVLFYKKEWAEGFRYVEKAATMGHRQAMFVAGYIHTGATPEFLKADHCKSLAWWQQAAERGHYAGELSLSRNYLRGVYKSCNIKLDHAKIIAYLESAQKKTKDYYQIIFVEYLLEQAEKGKK